MLYSKLIFVSILLVSIFLLNNCDEVIEKNDECDKTKWEEVKEPILYLYVGLNDFYCDPPDNQHYVPSATQMTFSGKVTKIYCDGTVSGSFDINTTFFPAQMQIGELAWIKVGQAYQFKFQNDKDYLLFAGRLTGLFSDGKKYESDEISSKIYYRNIGYDVNRMEYWSLYTFSAATKWVQVN